MRDKLRLGWDIEVSGYLYVFVFVVAIKDQKKPYDMVLGWVVADGMGVGERHDCTSGLCQHIGEAGVRGQHGS